MKPILIDALHINMGGALMILNHLVAKLVARNVNFVLLKDCRCPKLKSEDKVNNINVMSSDVNTRNKFYKSHRDDYKTVLCLGNIPPCIKLDVPVYTYIHNLSLLKIPVDNTFKQKVSNYLKREYIRYYAKNTDNWIVQTAHTSDLVDQYINKCGHPIEIYPFYYIPENMNRISVDQRQDYVFIGEYTGAKGHEYLVDAWGKLAKLGIKPILHLTSNSPKLRERINCAVEAGANIVNHGYVDFEQVIDIYNRSKVTVYPSLNESLGLGIIEAVEAGCDVIGCDLPYLYSVCKPSGSFLSRSSDAIVEAVKQYEKGNCRKSVLTIRDMADELIDLLIGW